MKQLRIPYGTWKAVLTNNPNWKVYQHADSSVSTLYAGTVDWLYVTTTYAEDLADLTTYLATRTVVAVVGEDDAIANVVGIKEHMSIRTEDGRLMMQPVTLDRGLWHWYHSQGDDLSAGRCAGTGNELQFTADAANPECAVTWQYNDWVELVGGVCQFTNAARGDYVTFELRIPASVPTSTPGTGNCNKVALGGGLHLIVPAFDAEGNWANTGDWTLATTDRTVCCPVLTSPEGSGYWEWSWPDTGGGAVTPGIPGKGHYQLYDFPVIPAARFIPKVFLLGSGVVHFLPENVHPTDVLPHWQLRSTLNHAGGDNTVEMVCHLVAARKTTL